MSNTIKIHGLVLKTATGPLFVAEEHTCDSFIIVYNEHGIPGQVKKYHVWHTNYPPFNQYIFDGIGLNGEPWEARRIKGYAANNWADYQKAQRLRQKYQPQQQQEKVHCSTPKFFPVRGRIIRGWAGLGYAVRY